MAESMGAVLALNLALSRPSLVDVGILRWNDCSLYSKCPPSFPPRGQMSQLHSTSTSFMYSISLQYSIPVWMNFRSCVLLEVCLKNTLRRFASSTQPRATGEPRCHWWPPCFQASLKIFTRLCLLKLGNCEPNLP